MLAIINNKYFQEYLHSFIEKYSLGNVFHMYSRAEQFLVSLQSIT